MNISDYQRYFKTKLDPEVVYAGEMLELEGLRFGVEFGTSNAIDKASKLVCDELEWQRHKQQDYT